MTAPCKALVRLGSSRFKLRLLLPAQALFRPVSMAVPDLALICEIMLMAEGFQESKLLSRKFIILYKLCEDLLSKVNGRNTGPL